MREEIRRVWRADRHPLLCDYSDVPPINGAIYIDGKI